MHLATSFNKLKDRDSTKIFTDKGLQLNVNHINLNKLKINQLYREKKYLETIPYLLNLDTIQKKDTYSKSMLGRVYYNLDSLEMAKVYFKKLIFKDKENYKPYTYLAHIALKQKEYKLVSINYRMATFIGKEKRDEEYYGLATVFFETNKPKEAILNFEKAFKENYKNYKALYQIAKLSEDYYKDKKIAYKQYKKYVDRFEGKDKEITDFVKSRIKEIKKNYFLKGEILE